MRFIRTLLTCGAMMVACLAPVALEDSVVAVVDNSIITQTQLMARTQLAAAEMGVSKLTMPQERALAKRTLAGLLDELLVQNDAKARGVAVTPEELVRAEQSLLKSGMPPELLARLKKDYGSAWKNKFAADVLWQKMVATVLRPKVNISQAEADRTVGEMLQNRQVLERELSQIVMSVPSADKENDVKTKMQELLEKLQNGEDFVTAAKAYSDDASGRKGGYMGWFANGQLNPALESALNNMKPGTVSNLIRTPAGWHILRLDNVRTTKPVDTAPVKEYELALVGYDGDDNANNNSNLNKTVNKLVKRDDVHAWVTVGKDDVRKDLPATKWLGWMNVKELHSAWQQEVAKTKPGHWTKLTRAGGTTGMIYVAGEREIVSPELVKLRERVQNSLFGNKLELETRNYLRTLRQRAFVDVRL